MSVEQLVESLADTQAEWPAVMWPVDTRLVVMLEDMQLAVTLVESLAD